MVFCNFGKTFKKQNSQKSSYSVLGPWPNYLPDFIIFSFCGFLRYLSHYVSYKLLMSMPLVKDNMTFNVKLI